MESFFASRWFGGPSVVGADDDGENPKSARDRKRAFASAWRPEGVVAGRERALRTAWTRAAAATPRSTPRARGHVAARRGSVARKKAIATARWREKKPASRRRASGTTNDGVRGVARGRATTASRRASRRRRRRPRVDGRAASSPRSPRPTTRLRRGQGFSLIAGRAARSPGNRRDATTRATRDVATRAMRRTGASATRTALGHLVLAVWKRRVRCPERASARMRRELHRRGSLGVRVGFERTMTDCAYSAIPQRRARVGLEFSSSRACAFVLTSNVSFDSRQSRGRGAAARDGPPRRASSWVYSERARARGRRS